MPSRSRSRTPYVLAALAAVVVVIAVVAIVVAGSGEEADAPSPTAAPAPGATGDASSSGAIDPVAARVIVRGDALAPFEGATDSDPVIGSAAPALTGTDYDGTPTEIRPGSDGPMMLVFLAHWCPHCNDEIPVLNEWRDSGAIPEDLRIVGVSTGVDPERPNYPPDEWLVEKDWQWDVLADGPFDGSAPPAALEAYGVTGYPFFTVIDADGNVAARGSGQLPIEQLEALVARVA